MSFVIQRKNGIAWIEFTSFSKYSNLIHFSTLRTGGYSSHPQASLNLGFRQTDSVEHVINNRRLLASTVGISLEQMVFSRQTHSDNIAIVSEQAKGRGVLEKHSAIPDNDGYILTQSGICACVLTADCVPVFIYDTHHHVAAIVHSGWRGTVKQIAAKAVRQLVRLGSDPKNIIAAIGPSIKGCCYEVKNDVLHIFQQSFGNDAYYFFSEHQGHLFLDISKAITHSLEKQGVLTSHIAHCTLCTKCNPHLFFSARNSTNGFTGRLASGIMLK